jgi:hypothetical protein
VSSPLFLTLIFVALGCLYLYAIASSFRISGKLPVSTPWLLLPLTGAAIAGVTLVFTVHVLPAPPVSSRLLALLAHLFTILLLWFILGKTAPVNRLPGTLLYAWNPLVLIELAVYANTAGVVICLLLLAVAMLIVGVPSSSFTRIVPTFRRGGGGLDEGRGRLRSPVGPESCFPSLSPTPAGDHKGPLPTSTPPPPLQTIAALVLIGLAVRINFMTLLIAPLLLWFMVRQARDVSSALMGFAWRALIVLAIFIVAYLPAWQGSATFLAITGALHLFNFAYSPLSLVVMPTRALFSLVAQSAHFPPSLMQPTIAADMTVLATSFFLFTLLYLREMAQVRARPYDTLFTSLAIVILGYIVLVATVFGPGYVVWVVWVVALRRFDRLSVCALLLSCSTLLYYPLLQPGLAATGILLPVCIFGIPLVYAVVQRYIPAGRIERKNVLT